MALGKKNRGFTIGRERASPLLFPYWIVIQTDLKNTATPPDEYDLSSYRLFDFSCHTDGFRAIVSLSTVFNLDFHTFMLKERSLMHYRWSCSVFVIRVVRHADGLNHVDNLLRWRWSK